MTIGKDDPERREAHRNPQGRFLVIEHSEIDAWIEKNFSGYGRALRTSYEPPLPGEPWMSMADAKWLTKRAVLELIENRPVE